MKIQSKIAGFMHRAGAAELLSSGRIKPGAALDLRPEPTNKHDPGAVRIEHGDTLLGYVPRSENRLVGAALKRGIRVACRKSDFGFNATTIEWSDDDRGDPLS